MTRLFSMLFYAVLATISAPVAHAQAEAPMLQAASLPLNVSRKVAFDTDEGSWISLDVSPDGRTIVFELLGDLYTLDARGGTAQLLLGGLAFETQPAFSPDGRQIAFLSDRSGSENLWIAAADGSNPRQLSRDDDNTAFASPAWSADGQTLYVSRGERPNQHNTVFYLWAYDVRGGGRTRLQRMLAPPECPSCPTAVLPALSDAAGHSALGVVPSADGRYLYFSSKAAGANRWQISCHDLETGEESAVVAIPGGAMKPVLSPDGRQLIYATRLDGQTGLRIRDLDSGTDRWLTYPVQTDASDYSVASRDLLPSSSFTPDGTALILNLDGKIQRLEIASGKSRPIPFTASVSLDVGPQLRAGQRVQDGPVRARVIQAPKQSPDARRVAFSALGQLYSMNLSNGKVRRVTDSIDAEFQPNWSPDGRQLTYVTWKAAGGGHVWRVSAEGGKPQRVSDYAAYYSDPVFAPDGKTIYALRSNNFERTQAHDEVSAVRAVDIVKISPSGKSEFVSRQAQIRNLHFTQDSSRIYFHSWDGSIRSVALDGTAGRVHVRIRGPGGKELQARTAAASNASISPDGRWLLAQFGLAPQLYLIGVPQMGEGILEIDLQQPTVSIQRVTDSGADYFAWADDGKTITWTLGPTFYRRSLSSIRLAPSSQPLADDAEGTQSFLVDLSIPRDLPRGALVLRGATVITMRGDEVIQDADIWIGDNRILNVGRRGSVAIPEHAQIRDISGKFVVPGFIDTHAHWFEIRRDVLDLQHWSFIANLAYGVTSGLDPQAYTSDMFVYEDMLDAGRMIGVRAFSTGPGMMANTLLATGEEAVHLQRRYREFYGTRNIKSYQIGSRRQRQLVVNAARELGMLPTTEGAGDLELDLTHAIDGFHGNEHALRAVPLYKDVVELFARTGIGYTITALGWPQVRNHFYIHESPHLDPKVNRFMPHFVNDLRAGSATWYRDDDQLQLVSRIAAQAAKIMRAGGLVGIGSHSEFQGLGYHWEMEAHERGGWSPREVLRAATLEGSKVIGREQDLGSIEPGKLADLVILDDNPLVAIRNARSIQYVMKNGRLYSGETLDEVWPRRRSLPPAWFASSSPQGASDRR